MSKHHSTSRLSRKLRDQFKTDCETIDAPCWLCGQPIDYDLPEYDEGAFERDHYHPVSTHKELEDDPANFRPAHRRCNQTRSNNKPRAEIGTLTRNWF